MGSICNIVKRFMKSFHKCLLCLLLKLTKFNQKSNKEKLWKIFNDYPFPYDPEFFFKIDIDFKNEIIRNYEQAILTEFNLEALSFTKTNQFKSTTFTACTFTNCEFTFEAFSNCSFVNCRFYNCHLIKNDIGYSNEYFTIFGCTADNGFTHAIVFECERIEDTDIVNVEKEILDLYLKGNFFKPRHRQLSYIKNELSKFHFKSINRALHNFEAEGIIQINGDLKVPHSRRNFLLS